MTYVYFLRYMIILAIDTSTDYLSLAILKGGKVTAKVHKKADRRHSMLLVPTIEKILKKTKLDIGKIDCFAISIGPGSFTGLRIGVTVIKGLAYALKKPISSVPTLDVIADNAKSFAGILCPVLDARKNKVYACLYKSDGKIIKRISKYLLLPLEELLKILEKYDKVTFLGDVTEDWPAFANNKKMTKCFGEAIRRSQSILYTFAGEGGWHPKAETVARLGLEYFRKKKFVKPEDLEPMYLYSNECDITGK
ncbi:MAG: tRNA (adenosine(37)-N6)-threonylcarbamoyltransferase complex dimerization subunit type 1 TsaB [Candidatus Omnitrophota bacterium]|nr:tRNA (adenosine(37)-N6)-threonylcarbamoyltransferase complex dimerization subunit type 1 TsaB [Candidatus Omnitrophota bacterium]